MSALSRHADLPYNVRDSDQHLELWLGTRSGRVRISPTVGVMTKAFASCGKETSPEMSDLSMISFALELAEDVFTKHAVVLDGKSMLHFLGTSLTPRSVVPLIVQASRGVILPTDLPLNSKGSTSANPYLRVVLMPIYHGDHFGMLAYHPQSTVHRESLFYYDSIAYAGAYKARVDEILLGMKRAGVFGRNARIRYVHTHKQKDAVSCGYFAAHYGRFLANSALLTVEPPVYVDASDTLVPSSYGVRFLTQERVARETAETSHFIQQLKSRLLSLGRDEPESTEQLVGGLTLRDVKNAFLMRDNASMHRVMRYSMARLKAFHVDPTHVFSYLYSETSGITVRSVQRPLESKSSYSARTHDATPAVYPGTSPVYTKGIWDDIRKSTEYDTNKKVTSEATRRVTALRIASAYLVAQFIAHRDRHPTKRELRYFYYQAGLFQHTYTLPQVVWHRLAMQVLADTVRVRSRLYSYVDLRSNPLLYAYLGDPSVELNARTHELSLLSPKPEAGNSALGSYVLNLHELQNGGARLKLHGTTIRLETVVLASLHADTRKTFSTNTAIATLPKGIDISAFAKGPFSDNELLQRGSPSYEAVYRNSKALRVDAEFDTADIPLRPSLQFVHLLGNISAPAESDSAHLTRQWQKSWSLLHESNEKRRAVYLRTDFLRELRSSKSSSTSAIVGQFVYTPFTVFSDSKRRFSNILQGSRGIERVGERLFPQKSDAEPAAPGTVFDIAIRVRQYVRLHNTLPPALVLYPVTLIFSTGNAQHTDYATLKQLFAKGIKREPKSAAWLKTLDDAHVMAGNMNTLNGSMHVEVPETRVDTQRHLRATMKLLWAHRDQRSVPQAMFRCLQTRVRDADSSVDALWARFINVTSTIGS